MIQVVETLCIPVSSDRCDRCYAICDCDYWHKNYTSFLCHFCMEEEKILHEDYTQKELKEYQVVTITNSVISLFVFTRGLESRYYI